MRLNQKIHISRGVSDMESVQGEGTKEVVDEKTKFNLINMGSRDFLAGLLRVD